jgi:hypothetical protein
MKSGAEYVPIVETLKILIDNIDARVYWNILQWVHTLLRSSSVEAGITIEKLQSSIYSQICVLKRPSLYIYLGIVQDVKQRQLYC